ncbi:group II intron maturase-specific domain-containing protein [Amphibacillus cookii]|uniref:group II intron maturase-specific domain-containing protein n=1 Tax=Amphibacillus cookii TaxID=767787 RepID=UPI003084117A
MLRVPHTKSYGKVGCRPTRSAKQRFRRKLKKLTSRKRAGEFKAIIASINRVTTGWINYYGIANMKKFIEETQRWLRRRLRQLIWKRWKRMRTRYRKLRGYGIPHDEALKLAASRKGYWNSSKTLVLHQAISNERLTKWGLKSLNLHLKSSQFRFEYKLKRYLNY